MRHIFKFPDIGEGLDEGTIIEWYVKKGQSVEAGESLVKMETDKVVTDIPSPRDGVIAARYGNEGETINVGDPLVEIEIEGVEGEAAQEESKKIDEGESSTMEPIEEEAAGVVGTLESAGNNAYLPSSDEGVNEPEVEQKSSQKKAIATPVARALAKELNIDINEVKGTGPGRRVMKEDIQKYANSGSKNSSNQGHRMVDEGPRVRIEPMSQMRKTIAKNMLRSKHNAAHMSVFDEVEASELIAIRSRFKEKFNADEIRLSYLPFIIKATAVALKKHPDLNSEMDMENGKMIYKNYVNIGIAVDTEDGLLVPVIQDADKLSIRELAIKVNEIAEKARKREISMEDMKDGTFTITSFGSIGGKFAVPVINYPQAGILGIGRIVKQPVVKNDAVVPGNMLPLSMSVDHRIVDGGEVTRFLNQIMEYLGDPINLIMD
ncbi:MAG: dihydrolipoamide acetyltransferase family protein [Bacteroidota bacterium]|nr:dihydrolipoamide acetyltransferase family protein [Bacteroidota bacterium]